jgi:hypothetical protein
MKPGDLIKYRNTYRIPAPLVGIILNEEHPSVAHRFFNVLLHDGTVKLISDHYMEIILEKGT